jgi:hypothetical protein
MIDIKHIFHCSDKRRVREWRYAPV